MKEMGFYVVAPLPTDTLPASCFIVFTGTVNAKTLYSCDCQKSMIFTTGEWDSHLPTKLSRLG